MNSSKLAQAGESSTISFFFAISKAVKQALLKFLAFIKFVSKAANSIFCKDSPNAIVVLILWRKKIGEKSSPLSLPPRSKITLSPTDSSAISVLKMLVDFESLMKVISLILSINSRRFGSGLKFSTAKRICSFLISTCFANATVHKIFSRFLVPISLMLSIGIIS